MNCSLSTRGRGMKANFSMERNQDRIKADRTKEDRRKKDMTNRVDYAIAADFCQVFRDHLDDFYTLSFLLTANHQKAEQCLVAGLGDCLHENPVFREWAQSWARRTVIKNAIRMISPFMTSPSWNETETTVRMGEPLSETDTAVAAITRLQPFDRFAYVLSVLERYSDSECSILLDCTVEKVVDARIRALQRVGSAARGKGPAEIALTEGAA
jgi:DNA-directed RNA polymerase specialized sigma24 family protein